MRDTTYPMRPCPSHHLAVSVKFDKNVLCLMSEQTSYARDKMYCSARSSFQS